MDVGVYDYISVSTDIERISTQNGKSGPGLALFDNGSDFISIVYKRDQARLILGATIGGSFRELAVVDPIADYSTAVLTVVIQQPNLSVRFDGVEVMTYHLGGLNVAETALLGSTRFGLAADNDNFSRFESFQVTDIS